MHAIIAHLYTFLHDGRRVISPSRRHVLDDGVAELDWSSTSGRGSPSEGEGTWFIRSIFSRPWVVVSDTNIPRITKAKLGEAVERSWISKSTNHIVSHLGTSLDQESPQGKRGTLGRTKSDCSV